MFAKLTSFVGMTGILLSGCAYRGHDSRMGVSGNRSGYYDGYYDGAYGRFNDGYWGHDGAFYYSDSSNNWHRDEGRHFRRDRGNGDGWAEVHGSGTDRDH